VHGPPGLGNNEREVDRNRLGPTSRNNNRPSGKNRTRRSPTGVDPNLNGDLPKRTNIKGNRSTNPNPLNVNPSAPLRNEGHPNNLKRSLNRPNEQLSDVDRHKTHVSHSAA
jgi:hypothetical protein